MSESRLDAATHVWVCEKGLRFRELRAQNFMALDAPCEEKLSTMVTEYNKLADQWTDLRSQLAEREAEVERLREAGDALAAAADRAEHSGREPALNAFYRALTNWHTATGGTTDE